MEAWNEEKPSKLLDWVDAILEKKDRVYSAISNRKFEILTGLMDLFWSDLYNL